MIYLEPGVYVRIEQLEGRAHPLPLQNGFTEGVAYRALGLFNASETSECYYILGNDRDETWFISNRHLRIVGLYPQRYEMRFPLAQQGSCTALDAGRGDLALEAQSAGCACPTGDQALEYRTT